MSNLENVRTNEPIVIDFPENIIDEEPFFCENGCCGLFKEIYHPQQLWDNFVDNYPCLFYFSIFLIYCLITVGIVILDDLLSDPLPFSNKISDS